MPALRGLTALAILIGVWIALSRGGPDTRAPALVIQAAQAANATSSSVPVNVLSGSSAVQSHPTPTPTARAFSSTRIPVGATQSANPCQRSGCTSARSVACGPGQYAIVVDRYGGTTYYPPSMDYGFSADYCAFTLAQVPLGSVNAGDVMSSCAHNAGACVAPEGGSCRVGQVGCITSTNVSRSWRCDAREQNCVDSGSIDSIPVGGQTVDGQIPLGGDAGQGPNGWPTPSARIELGGELDANSGGARVPVGGNP